jgi:hypothetical protein
MAIRELLMWTDEHGEAQLLDSRYRKAAGHIHCDTTDFGRRQEPKLLGECARLFVRFDYEDRGQRQEPADVGERRNDHATAARVVDVPASRFAPHDPTVGITSVHEHLDQHQLARDMRHAKQIAILNTWIPELNLFEHTLITALAQGAHVRILMLHPYSDAAPLRSAGLPGSTQARWHLDRVRLGVKQCLDVLGAIAGAVDDDSRARLAVRLYDSLPSISVYSIDEHAFVSFFLHGQLAISAPQIEIQGKKSLFGRTVFGELQTLWDIAAEFADIRHWREEIDEMSPGRVA